MLFNSTKLLKLKTLYVPSKAQVILFQARHAGEWEEGHPLEHAGKHLLLQSERCSSYSPSAAFRKGQERHLSGHRRGGYASGSTQQQQPDQPVPCVMGWEEVEIGLSESSPSLVHSLRKASFKKNQQKKKNLVGQVRLLFTLIQIPTTSIHISGVILDLPGGKGEKSNILSLSHTKGEWAVWSDFSFQMLVLINQLAPLLNNVTEWKWTEFCYRIKFVLVRIHTVKFVLVDQVKLSNNQCRRE